MEIKIMGWGYENIRRFNTLYIDLQQNNEKLSHTTLVMMRNGTGKTTTITLMRATLSGSATKWEPEKVREFRPVNGQSVRGKFYIKIKFDSELYHYNLILDYEQGKALYETSCVGLSGGMKSEHVLPIQLRGIFDNEGFINRFIFDGEQAKKTLNTGSREAELAVTYLYQIDKLDDLISQINLLVQRKQSESDSKGATSTSLSYNRTRMENKRKNHLGLISRCEELNSLITNKKQEWDRLEERRTELIASDERLRQEQSRLIEDKTAKTNELFNILQVISLNVKEPYQIHSIFNERLKGLMQNMQTLKLPKTTAREFFRELSESEECVCGRPIGENEKQAILKRADNYLGEDDLNAINAIKDKLRNYKINDTLLNSVQHMVVIKENIQNIQSAMDRLILQLDEEAIHEAELIANSQSTIKQDLLELEKERNVLIAPIGSPNITEQNNIAMAEKVWKEAQDNLLRATGTYEYTQKANRLNSYIKSIRLLTLQKLKDDIVKKTNEKIASIITDEKIIVEKINGSLILKDKAGVSEGQTLAIAYSYIGSLFEHSSFEFPFVIDSPAASMDLSVRREVANIIPNLFKQLIIFVTSGEVAGFAEKFYGLDDVLYATVEGKDTDEKALCTFGKEYFSLYQSEEEG
jgi:hypothetical protein